MVFLAWLLKKTYLAWFKSYLCGRHQKYKIDKSFSDSSLYTAPLRTIISNYGLSHHLYAEDTQICIPLTGDAAGH